MFRFLIQKLLRKTGPFTGSVVSEYRLNNLPLDQLRTLFDIPLEADFVVETQKKWLRKPHQERWELEELDPLRKSRVLQWARQQGIFSAITPTCKIYDQALILGAITSSMVRRLEYLKKLWLQGVRFREIVWLTGDRPLDCRVDQWVELCKNESQAARYIWEEADLPKDMRSIPLVYVAVPMKKDGGTLKRPNTEDTIMAWLKTIVTPYKSLFISDQPFCGYQYAVIKSCLPEGFLFEVVGPEFDPSGQPLAAAITLDALARWAYQENLNLKSK